MTPSDPPRPPAPPQATTQTTAPAVPLDSLDTVWFQVAGTRCNLSCTHCFISCHPKNDSFGFLSLAAVRERLAEAERLGVREFYFTGGEPFLNKEMVPILEATLAVGPATVLTNGTVLKDDWLVRLAAAEAAGPYSLEFRVSIDGPDAATNDPVRGAGTFAKALAGVGRLVAHGFLPILTMTRIWDDADDLAVMRSFTERLREVGYERPRIKLLPRLKIGAEAERTAGYDTFERVTHAMMAGFDRSQLVCSSARCVSDRGVHVCPILLEAPDSVLGDTLTESAQPFPLAHGACFTCYQYGSICSNVAMKPADDPQPVALTV